MGRIFAVGGENLSLGTGNVLLAMQTAAAVNAGCIVALRRLEIYQSGTSTSAQIRGEFFKRDTAGTLTTTSVTPQGIIIGGPASGLSGNTSVIGGAARIGVNSSADSGGTYTSINPFGFNNLNGYLWIPVPEERVIIPPSTVAGVRLLASPATTTGWTVSLEFEEVV
jgi:hypothetical protein